MAAKKRKTVIWKHPVIRMAGKGYDEPVELEADAAAAYIKCGWAVEPPKTPPADKPEADSVSGESDE